MSRFSVGEKYIFVSQSFQRVSRFDGFYEPWSDKDLNNEIIVATCESEHEVSVATCESEHEVSVEHTDQKAKGYIFSDQHGRIWYNQYPVAYDSCDGLLILHYANEANFDNYCHHIKKTSCCKNNKESIHHWYFWYAPPKTLDAFVSPAFNFITEHSQYRNTNDDIRNKCILLEDYLGALIAEVEKEGCKVSLNVRRVQFKDKPYSIPMFCISPSASITWNKPLEPVNDKRA